MGGTPIPTLEVVVAELGDEVALLLPDSGETLLLNPTAAEVWAQCDGEQDVAAIVAVMQSAFPDEGELAAQVEAVVDDLARRGFLSWRSEHLDHRDTPHPSAPPR